MLLPSRLLAFAGLAALVHGAAVPVDAAAGSGDAIVPPSERVTNPRPPMRLDTQTRRTDIAGIRAAIAQVGHRTGAPTDALPGDPVIYHSADNDDVEHPHPPGLFPASSPGSVTPADHTPATKRLEARTSKVPQPKKKKAKKVLATRAASEDFELVFEGTGTEPEDRDAAVEDLSYMTFTLVSNATYNVEDCLDFCAGIEGCVFANLYYEYNNYLLDFVAAEKSNLKCAVFGEVLGAEKKTNFGGQQSYSYPAPTIYIQNSGGWALRDDGGGGEEPEEPIITTPEGYEYVFGPIAAATDAPGYLGFDLLDHYDTEACAASCNSYEPFGLEGHCQFFNLWRAVLDGVPDTYACALYSLPTDESTATYTGDADLTVSLSRGYRRTSYALDGSFETFPCASSFCFEPSYARWVGTSPQGGYLDATIFSFAPYARTGAAVALLGSATGADALPGTLTHAAPLATKPNRKYVIAFWQDSTFGGQGVADMAFVEVVWNGEVVGSWKPGFKRWSYHSVVVEARGGDVVAFRGGRAPAWTFVDDVVVFLV